MPFSMHWHATLAALIPLEKVGEVVNDVVLWWGQLVSHIAPDKLPLYVYFGFCLLVLVLWILVARVLPKTLAGLSWIILFAILLTPTTSLGKAPQIAPASVGVVYGILLKDSSIIFNSLLPILLVITVGCVLGFLWQMLKLNVEKSVARAEAEQANPPPMV